MESPTAPGANVVSWGIVIIAVTIGFYFMFIWKSRAKRMLENLPGPPTLPIFGNALELNVSNEFLIRGIPFGTTYYGPMYVVWVLSLPYLFVSDIQAIEKILSSQIHIEKSRDYTFLYPWLGQGLLTSRGERWFVRRKQLTPAFHFKILDDFLVVINEQTRVLVDVFKNGFSDGRPFNVFPYITRCALDIICETAMGKKINAQLESDSEYVKAIYRISELIQHRQLRPWLHPDFIWRITPSGREEKKCLEILHGFTDKVIREKKLERSGRDVKEAVNSDAGVFGVKKRLAFLDLLLETQEKEGISSLSDEALREETDTFMFEGHDTTAANANWTTFLLGCHPEFQSKVHEELDEIFGDDRERPVTMQDMTQMKYLECCIKESLRLYPSVPFIARGLQSDLQLNDDVTIPAGTTTFIMPYQLHRDAKVFPEPEAFLPDRFFPENATGRNPFAYLPFSAGPRNCIGQKFAMMEEKVLLANIFRNFRVEAAERREDLVLLAELIMRPKHGLSIKLTPRH